VIDFGYGRTDVSTFPRAAWLRSARTVLTTAPNDRFAYLDGRGVPELHDALTDYLNRVRGTAARPEHMVISNGYGQGVTLLIQVLAARGARRLAVEDPSSTDDAHVVARGAGSTSSASRSGRTGCASRIWNGRRPTPSSSPRRTSGPPAACSRPTRAPG
jgi:aspartate/methionine/tyrosine aminotransferase